MNQSFYDEFFIELGVSDGQDDSGKGITLADKSHIFLFGGEGDETGPSVL